MNDVSLTDDNLENDIECSKLCSQPSCRRISVHCTNLLDAVLIFKTWFIQRQHELGVGLVSSTSGRISENAACVVPYDTSSVRPDEPTKSMIVADSSLLAEREWALNRVRRMEHQISRLRSACLAMRVQLEAGLRHKSEADRVKHDLEMTLNTLAHYQNIIAEGNRLRDDLRTELDRVRKEASIARSQLYKIRMAPVPTSTVICSPAQPLAPDHADTSATMALTLSTFPNAYGGTTQEASSAILLRNELERQTRLSDSLKAEVANLREAVRRVSEKDTECDRSLDIVRSHIQLVVNQISSLEVRHPSERVSPFGSILNLDWFTDLVGQLHVSLPAKFMEVATSFASTNQSPEKPASTNSHKRKGNRIEKRSKKLRRISPRLTKTVSSEQSCTTNSPSSFGHDSGLSGSGSKYLDQILSELNFAEDAQSEAKGAHGSSKISPLSLTVESSSAFVTESGDRHLSTSDFDRPGVPVSSDQFIENPSYLIRSHHANRKDQICSSLVHTVDLDQEFEVPQKQFLLDHFSTPTPIRSVQYSTVTDAPPADSHLVLATNNRVTTSSCCISADICEVNVSSTTKPITGSKKPINSISKNNGVEDIASRISTCPLGYSRKLRQSESPADAKKHVISSCDSLLSLLHTSYSYDIVERFDRLTSESVTCEPVDGKNVSPIEILLQPSDSCMDLDFTRPCKVAITEPSSNETSSKSIANELFHQTNVDYLLQGCSSYFQRMLISPPVEIVSMLSQQSSDVCARVIWESFLRHLVLVDITQSEKQEVLFTNLCTAVGHPTLVRQISEWLMNNLNTLQTAQLIIAARCLFRLFSESAQAESFSRIYFTKLLCFAFTVSSSIELFAVQSLPCIVDACQSRFPKCFLGVNPLHDSAASQLHRLSNEVPSFSYVIATVQALLAWEEAYLIRFLATRSSKLTQHAHKQTDDEAVFARLHSYGWLPGRRADYSRSSAVASLSLAQQNSRLRCLALLLVDTCLGVHQGGEAVRLYHADDLSPKAVESASSLYILLITMSFIVGNDAMVEHQRKICRSRSSNNSHQRKRRSRQVLRQHNFGLLGWLISNRLIPRINHHGRLLTLDNSSVDARLMLSRLVVLTTDLVILGGYLFSLCSVTEKIKELRTAVFVSGRRLLHLLENNISKFSSTTLISSCLRLFSFSPERAMKLLLRSTDCSRKTEPFVPVSFFWTSISIQSLLDESISLLSAVPNPMSKLVTDFKCACDQIRINL